MNKLTALILVLAVLCIAFSAHSPAEEAETDKILKNPIGEVQIKALEKALEAANLTIKDLSFDKKPIDDPLRLDVVNRMLDEPLFCAELTHETGIALEGAAENPQNAIGYMASLIDLAVKETEFHGPANPRSALMKELSREEAAEMTEGLSKLQGLPRSVPDQIYLILWAMQYTDSMVRKALEPLSDEQKKLVLTHLPSFACSDVVAFAEGMDEEVDAMDVMMAANSADLDMLATAAVFLAQVVSDVTEELASLDDDTLALLEKQHMSIRTNTPLGPVVFGSLGADLHEKDAALLIDLGGDDVYKNSCAAAIAPWGDRAGSYVSCLIDVKGDDRYMPPAHGVGCGTGIMGIGMLFDAEGDDYYSAGHLSIGAGLLGVGLVVDRGGSDYYRSDTFTQGAGMFGIGLLAEADGGDIYRGAKFAQGFGYPRGCGAIADDKGVDNYFAGGKYLHVPLLPTNYQSLSQGFGFGIRGLRLSGGVGIIADASGNDTYTAEVYGQGSSYWYAAGLLIDGGGNDYYCTTQYSVGAGIHLSAGALLDRGGNDHYYCKNGVGIGGSHDYSVGVLIDCSGDDYYQGAGAAQGTGHTNGVGLLFDLGAGNDAYSGIKTSLLQGGGSERRDTASIGVLIDFGGPRDTYSTGVENGELRVKGVYGVCYDMPDPPEEEE
ncbi:MAG: hypothetical protein U5N86_04955 [Planctomycetota bacterium]|nr:hypothetical protein [Planctomycetota bacterium]